MATLTRPLSITAERTASIPWYLWCSALAVTSVTIGAHWDVSWHRSIGRDSFWTPAHMAIYLCGVLAGITCGYLILDTTFRRNSVLRALGASSGLHRSARRISRRLGRRRHADLRALRQLVAQRLRPRRQNCQPAAHRARLGIFAVESARSSSSCAAMNRASNRATKATVPAICSGLILYLSGLMLVLTMFFRMEYTWDVYLHKASAYISVAIGVPLYYAAVWKASRHRWAATWMTAIYTVTLIAFILILPLFPAEPKLGPVFQHVTHFIPPIFPLLLIVPAILLDLLWLRIGDRNKLVTAAISGPVFVLALVAVQWPFATFLMTKAAQNRFFGSG